MSHLDEAEEVQGAWYAPDEVAPDVLGVSVLYLGRHARRLGLNILVVGEAKSTEYPRSATLPLVGRRPQEVKHDL